MTPDGWAIRRLDEIATQITSGGTPKVGCAEYYDGDIPFLKIEDITRSRSRYLADAKTKITRLAIQETAAKVYPPGTIFVTMYGTIGAVGISATSLSANQAIAALVGLRGADADFVAYLLEHDAPRLAQKAGQTTQANISGTILKAHEVALPPLSEQRKIAAILSSFDAAIEATQAVIDQLGVVKKATMAELLTRGLPGRHTKFKQTEIGELPEGWDVELLDSVARRGSGHTPSKSHPEYWDGEVKWVSLQDSKSLDRVYIGDTTAKITPLGIANSSAVEHPAGTVILSRDAGVGKSAITTAVMAVSQHFIAWVCGSRLDNHYLYYWLQQMKPEFERVAIGNTIKTIGLPYFKVLRLPVPPLAEQRAIAEGLRDADQRIFAEEHYRDQLRAVKSALMSVLLTGELRVKPDEDAP